MIPMVKVQYKFITATFSGTQAFAKANLFYDIIEDACIDVGYDSVEDIYQQIDKLLKNRFSVQHAILEEVRLTDNNVTYIARR